MRRPLHAVAAFAAGKIAAFFAAPEMGGIAANEGLEQNRFGLAVDIGNKIVKRFAVYFNGIEIGRSADHHIAGFARGFECGV